MKQAITAILIMIFLSGCNMQKYCATHYPPIIQNDSTANTTVEYVRHDSTVYIPPDSSWLKMYLECDKNGNVIMRELSDYRAGKHLAPPKVVIKDNYLTAQCKSDTNSIGLYWFNKYVRSNVKVKTQAVKLEYRLTKFQSFFVVCGYIFWGVVLIIIAVWLIKKYAKVSIPFLK